MSDAIALRLAANLRQLREARRLTQSQAAKLAGLPRPTWTTLESGSANPTLQVLLRSAAALQVPLEELLGPARDTARVFRAAALRTRKRGAARVRDLLRIKLTELDERLRLLRDFGRTLSRHLAACEQELDERGKSARCPVLVNLSAPARKKK